MQRSARRGSALHVSRFRFYDGGFTLIETLVAVGVFAVVVSIAVGGFVRALRTQRQVAALVAANSNASIAIEQMAREIRTGYDFCGGQQCLPADKLAFRNAGRQPVMYCLNNKAIERAVGGAALCGSGEKITAENIAVQYLSFVVMGNRSDDGMPPRITIAVGISPREAGVSESVVRLQTTVSARPLDG